ncbi:GNAT family N-acetyltransferase [Streptomyces mangrovisoli]|uniref:Lysine N-acyltransferase MbtK n=1 Tax=Streptomyces mangrovisoli TaxID=1428628 RepID=A0A1J4NQU8_9ACTN|nr:GNAT family N-acetyltransferase [Streptomyces mangrovisoli]OIJ64680.1 hypothetical protein WN71_027680 [Streptomyces mangrovisoli]
MPPIDAGAATVEPDPSGPGGTSEDTLELRLPGAPGRGGRRASRDRVRHADADTYADADTDTYTGGALRSARAAEHLDGVAGWGPVATPVGAFQLVPVVPHRDLPLVARWMNDPAVAEFWELAGPPSRTAAHLEAQLDGDGRSVPCLGLLDGAPMSYWEVYRADLDPLARHYPARRHDTGLHLLLGGAEDRGRGLGSALLRAVADLVLDRRPACSRVVAEPDLRNVPSVAAFLTGGFRFAAEIEIDLPPRRAALMIRDRALRDVL